MPRTGRLQTRHGLPKWPFAINRDSWESQGLVAWFPYANQILSNYLVDFANPTTTIPFVNGAGPLPAYAYGVGLGHNANDRGARGLCPSYLKNLTEVTVVWIGAGIGAATAATSIFGTSYDNLGSSPFAGYGLGHTAGGDLRGQLQDAGGVFREVIATSYAFLPGSFYSVVFSIRNGAQAMYINGELVASGTHSWNGGGQSATSQIVVGVSAVDVSRVLNAVTLDARIYDRAWTASDARTQAQTYWELYRQKPALYFADPTTVSPFVETLVATNVTSSGARLRGRIDPNGTAVEGRFAWGTSPGSLINITTPTAIGSGDIFVTYGTAITGLDSETTYYFQAIGNDGAVDFEGEVLSFFTAGEPEFVDGSVSYPLAWLELTKRDEEMKPFAEVDLNDAPTYYGGYKAPWVKRFHGVSRGLSDRDGQIEHLTFGALFADTLRYFRGLLEDVVNKYLTNRPLVERFIDDEDRRIEGLPRIAAVGYVNDYAPRENLEFDLKGSDWLKKKFSRKRRAQQSWQPLITREDFPNCSDDVVNIAAPLIYGSLGLSGADPVENVQITINAQPSAAPGSFAVALVAGGRLAGVRRYYKVAGIVGGQETVQTATLTAVTDNTNKTIRLTWTAVPSATAIYVYSSHRPDFSQFAYTVLAGGATSYDDDTTPPNQDKRWLDGTDWLLGLRLNLSYYVYADIGGGVFSRPGVASTFIAPIPYDTWQANGLEQRDIDVTYDAHPDETDGYRVVRRRSYYSDWDPRFDRQWDTLTGVLTVTDDAITNTAVDVPAGELLAAAAAGQVQAIPIGRFDFNGTQLNGLLLCRCASARVGKVYVPVTTENVEGETETTYEPVPESEFGVTWFAPDHAGWPYADKFVDINVRRYTLIGTTVDPLPDKVLVDVDGIETDGDGDGELIRSIVQQRLHFMNNFIAPDTPYASGAYLTAADTTFPHLPELPLVDEASHNAAEAALEERLPGGYEGAGIIGSGGDFISATDALAQFHVSADVDQAFNRKGQDTISAEPIALADDPPAISDVINIKDGSFSLADQVQNAFFNILPFAHTRDYTGRTPSGWYGVGEERSQTSIDNYDQERESPRFELHFLRSNTIQGAATIVDVMQRKKARYMDPRRSGTLTMPFEGLTYEPGDVVEITAVEGIGASGWTGRQVRVTHHNAFPSEGQIVLDFYDLELVLENQGSP